MLCKFQRSSIRESDLSAKTFWSSLLVSELSKIVFCRSPTSIGAHASQFVQPTASHSFSASYTLAIIQFVKPTAIHGILVDSARAKIIGFDKFLKGCFCIPCPTASKFESSKILPSPVLHTKFQQLAAYLCNGG